MRAVRLYLILSCLLGASVAGCGGTNARVMTTTVEPTQSDADAFAANLEASYAAPIAPRPGPHITARCSPTGKTAIDTSAERRPVFRCTVSQYNAEGKLVSRTTDCSVQEGDGTFYGTTSSGEAYPLAGGACPH